MGSENTNRKDEAKYKEQKRSNKEYDIEYNVDTSRYDEQQRSLLLVWHGEIASYGAAGMGVRRAANEKDNIQSYVGYWHP